VHRGRRTRRRAPPRSGRRCPAEGRGRGRHRRGRRRPRAARGTQGQSIVSRTLSASGPATRVDDQPEVTASFAVTTVTGTGTVPRIFEGTSSPSPPLLARGHAER